MAEELAKWASKLDELDVTFCIKPHSKQAMGRPEELLWMLDKVNHPRMKGVYDYGHFMAFGLGLEETIRQVAPRCGFVHIKDTVGKAPDHRFVLPGDGGVDYARFLKTMAEVGYHGPIVVEVSTERVRPARLRPGRDGPTHVGPSLAGFPLRVSSRLVLDRGASWKVLANAAAYHLCVVADVEVPAGPERAVRNAARNRGEADVFPLR